MPRDSDEIQRAHDMLAAILLQELAADKETAAALRGALDALCWVLDNDHNQAFAVNLKRIEKFAEENGYVLREEPD